MSILLSLLMLLGQTQPPSDAAVAADKFALDLPTAEAAPAAPGESAASVVAPTGGLSLDTPIADLIANPQAKAILDRDLPGLSDDENLPKFQALSLRRMAPLSGGQMTPALLAKVAADLAKIEAAPVAEKKVQVRRALPSGR